MFARPTLFFYIVLFSNWLSSLIVIGPIWKNMYDSVFSHWLPNKWITSFHEYTHNFKKQKWWEKNKKSHYTAFHPVLKRVIKFIHNLKQWYQIPVAFIVISFSKYLVLSVMAGWINIDNQQQSGPYINGFSKSFSFLNTE